MHVVLVNCHVLFKHIESRHWSKRALLSQIPACLFQTFIEMFYKTHFLWQSGPLTLQWRKRTVKWSKCKKRGFLRTVRRSYFQQTLLLFIPQWKKNTSNYGNFTHIRDREDLCLIFPNGSLMYCLSLDLPGGFKWPTWWCYLFGALCFSLERLHSRTPSAQLETLMIKHLS